MPEDKIPDFMVFELADDRAFMFSPNQPFYDRIRIRIQKQGDSLRIHIRHISIETGGSSPCREDKILI